LEEDEVPDLDCSGARYSEVQNEVGKSISRDVSLLDGGMVLATHVNVTISRRHRWTHSQILDIPNRPSNASSYDGSEHSNII
jgi:hypothetical protein